MITCVGELAMSCMVEPPARALFSTQTRRCDVLPSESLQPLTTATPVSVALEIFRPQACPAEASGKAEKL
jgi:hypothetical protein